MDIASMITMVISAIFINNFILARFLGFCPFFGVSKKTNDTIGMGLAVIFVMVLASFATWLVYTYMLVPLKLEFLRTITFILVIAALVQFVELFLKKSVPALYKSLGIYLPLITTNCAILGVTVLNIDQKYNLVETIVNALASGIGFLLIMLLMSTTRERLEFSDIPKSFRGMPIAFIIASLFALAFLGFQGLKFG
jgi:Na+-translocating ferredoxin:NAD+ oxidoreductase subunit A